MKVVVGLGNPGSSYAGTRHNVGFEVIDALAAGPGGGKFQRRFDAEVAEGLEGWEKILYVKPLTFMNLSGRSVRQAIDFYQVSAADLLIICDDINLPLGQLRLRPNGAAGGHNGLKDIQRHVGTSEYARLKLGVGAPDRSREEVVDYVLARFKPGERKVVSDMILRASQAVGVWIKEGVEAAMNRFNAPEKQPKPKKPRKEQTPSAPGLTPAAGESQQEPSRRAADQNS
jgi:PTH1 family peptidyl-tRNA hydrolase